MSLEQLDLADGCDICCKRSYVKAADSECLLLAERLNHIR